MGTFYNLYNRLIKSAIEHRLDDELHSEGIKDFDPYQLDCLLHPERHSVVIGTEPCDRCSREDKDKCKAVCMFGALRYDEDGNIQISDNLCTGCSECIDECRYNALTDNTYVIPVLEMLMDTQAPVYALIAPAFIKQFGPDMSEGRLRSVLKKLGFAGMIEVALFADILTLKESIEFDRSIKHDDDYMLTSCCCPIWIGMIRKVYSQLVPHLPPSVSPMVACGRVVKKLYPGAKTVFIGPCIAKKAEAKEPDICDAIDYVLTFQELKDIFDAANIVAEEFEEDSRDHSSAAGRMYARTGGVSRAVQNSVDRLSANREIKLISHCANGVKECKEMLASILQGDIQGNFFEGMGCVGGCAGGPKSILPKDESIRCIDEYTAEASAYTPADNPYVIELLHKLGFGTIDSLLEDNDVFIRKF